MLGSPAALRCPLPGAWLSVAILAALLGPDPVGSHLGWENEATGQADQEKQEAGGPDLRVQCHCAVRLAVLLLRLGLALVSGSPVTVAFMGPPGGGGAGMLSPLPFGPTHFQEGGGAEKAGEISGNRVTGNRVVSPSASRGVSRRWDRRDHRHTPLASHLGNTFPNMTSPC